MKVIKKRYLFTILLFIICITGANGSDGTKIDSGATAWMLTSTALVLLMVPGLAMFYGGLVRSKNVLGTIMHCYIAMGIISILWVIVGYSMCFGKNILGGWFGWNSDYFFLKGIDNSVMDAGIPEYVFSMFQGKFAIITPALIAGAFAERVSFKAYCFFIAIWSLLVYNPICHWVWASDGFLFNLGAKGTIDFAGGTVVHISAGVSGLVAALYLGSRRGYPFQVIRPNNLVITMLGAGLLWVGWFGFNGGSALARASLREVNARLIAIERALEYYQLAKGLSHVEIAGVHQHIGSQITEVQPFVDSLEILVRFITELRSAGIVIKYINIGGGLGITYKDEPPPLPHDVAQALMPLLKSSGCTIVLEPGRAIVGNAGILVTTALYHKDNGGKRFLIVDAGMNDLIRPSLYEAYHDIRPVIEPSSLEKSLTDVVGPICESGDFLAKDRKISNVKQGELLAVMGAGAYGFSMSSNYNSRPLVAEVMVKGNEYYVVRERETYNDLIKGEKIPRWLVG